jgi:hypothetical protein
LTRFRPTLNWKRPLKRFSTNTGKFTKRKNNKYGKNENSSGSISRR